MGHSASSLLLCRRPPELRVLIFGLDASGKTSLLYRLKTGELITTIPTIGFNVETVVLEGRATLTLWDVGGRSGIRPLLRHYFKGMQGAVFIIDSNDRERLSEAIEFMNSLCESMESDGVLGVPVAVLCNKCDIQNLAVSDTQAEVQKLLSDETALPGLGKRPRACFAVSVATGEGLTDAMNWLVGAALKVKPAAVDTAGRDQGTEKQIVSDAAGDEGERIAAKSVGGWSGLYRLVKSAMLR